MLDPFTNLSGIVNLLYGTLVTFLQLFFGPFIEVVGPLLQIFNLGG